MGFRTQEIDGWGSDASMADINDSSQGFSVFACEQDCCTVECRFPITRPAEPLTTNQIRYVVDQEFNGAEARQGQE